MKYDLVKFHHWLLVSTFRNKWFEENIKLQIISLLSWFIYPDFRKSNSIFTVLKQNKFILGVLSVFILWTSGFFTIGKLMSIPEKTYEYIFVRRVEEKIVEKQPDPNIRKFIQNLIIEDCKIEHPNEFRSLPDQIFFLMIDEVNRNSIPYTIFFKVVDHESGFQFITNLEGSGAMGYCQIMPATFRQFKKEAGLGSHNPVSNIKMGAFLLKNRYNYYRSNGHKDDKAWFLSLKDYAGGKDSMAREIIKIYKNKQ
jgi:hypothetical protein